MGLFVQPHRQENSSGGNQPPGFPDLGALMGGLFAGKGNSKGQSAPSPTQPGAPGPDLGALLGGLFAGKGMGKGARDASQSQPATAEQSSPPPDLGALLGGLLGAAKGHSQLPECLTSEVVLHRCLLPRA